MALRSSSPGVPGRARSALVTRGLSVVELADASASDCWRDPFQCSENQARFSLVQPVRWCHRPREDLSCYCHDPRSELRCFTTSQWRPLTHSNSTDSFTCPEQHRGIVGEWVLALRDLAYLLQRQENLDGIKKCFPLKPSQENSLCVKHTVWNSPAEPESVKHALRSCDIPLGSSSSHMTRTERVSEIWPTPLLCYTLNIRLKTSATLII